MTWTETLTWLVSVGARIDFKREGQAHIIIHEFKNRYLTEWCPDWKKLPETVAAMKVKYDAYAGRRGE